MNTRRSRQSTTYNVFVRITGILFLVLMSSLHNAVRAENSLERENPPLIMGVLPYVSSMKLFKHYAPLKDHLAEKLGREILLETAKDFSVFALRTRNRHYDILITAPHLAVSADDSNLYRIITRVKQDLVTQIVVAQDSNIKSVSQLAGTVIATPPEISLVAIYGKKTLLDAGIGSDDGTIYRAYKSQNAAYDAVLINHATAAIVSSNAIRQIIGSSDLRVISTLAPLPVITTLVATDLSESSIKAITNILITLQDDNKGLAVLEKLRLPGYQVANIEDYKAVRQYMSTDKNTTDHQGTD